MFLIKISICFLCTQFFLYVASETLDSNSKATQNLEDRIVYGLKEYALTGYISTDLEKALELVKAPHIFNGLDFKRSHVVCTLCKIAARLLLLYQNDEVPLEDIKTALKVLCVEATSETENVCNGVIELNTDIFVYIIDNKPNITTDLICSTIAQPFKCPIPPEDDNWSVEIPPKLENPINLQNILNENISEPIRVLHITDLHYDELYIPGANAECGEPLCCGINQGVPTSKEDEAGNWGDYRSCDMPWYTLLDLMSQVTKHKYDYMYFTGDIINHRVWATSIENNLINIKKVYKLFQQTFKSTPVFPILGNHEPNPLNEFAQRNVTDPALTTQWLYDAVAEEWSYWLPESTKDTIKKGGYYTVVVRPGFRIIALNSNVAYTFNWWLLYDHSILQEQLQWLADTLYEAEKNSELVHILSHIPTGDNTCLIKWSREFKKIIHRFAHIISAQFVGHTHFDEMNLFFNNSNINEPISVVFNGGSFTTFIDVNPNYVIYEINQQTLEVEDYDEWIYNITEANENSVLEHPRWFKLYSFKEAYGLKSMQLPELSKLVQNMATNQTILDQYYRFKMRAGDKALQNGCDQNCHENNLCNLVTTQFTDEKICLELIENYQSTLP